MSDVIQAVQEQYITDAEGRRLSVVLGFEYFRQLLARLEELEEIYAFDLAKESEDEAIPLDRAIAEINKCQAVYS